MKSPILVPSNRLKCLQIFSEFYVVRVGGLIRYGDFKPVLNLRGKFCGVIKDEAVFIVLHQLRYAAQSQFKNPILALYIFYTHMNRIDDF
jgi:hypothetical protein